ncbi:inositol monophosphatase family protein [Pleomorphovibrio marinus]|uniref:inositol monophosphatase family protein n=1 Tax=Pleomorphovibrio marinus TaxID=2164132 RepID=UPI000E0B9DAD|nr:inositol monophosphatase family protein [Pleomorphovibrio marinus]
MDLKEIANATCKIAKKAGAFIRKEKQGFSLANVELKGFNDLVSYVDKEAEKIIVSELSTLLPQAGFITEEGTESDPNQEYTWIVDPLDGTTNFVHGIPIFAVSIALAKGEKIVAGVVYEVNLDECFYAYEGGGAFCNNDPIQVSFVRNISESLIAHGFPYDDGGKMGEYLQFLQHLLKNSHGLRRLGSAAVDLCYVACGRAEGYFEYNLQSYDVAAGALIVKEAGGKVSDFSGGDDFIFGGQILSTNGSIHEELRASLNHYFTL